MRDTWMMRLSRPLLVALMLTPALHAEVRPHWIWATKDRQSRQKVALQKSFSVAKDLRSATLSGVADFNELEIFLNQQSVAVIDNYGPKFTIDVTGDIRNGDNQLLLRSTSSAGPAAIT